MCAKQVWAKRRWFRGTVRVPWTGAGFILSFPTRRLPVFTRIRAGNRLAGRRAFASKSSRLDGRPPAAAPVAVECAQFRPRATVRLVATGSTIANHPDGRLTADELANLIPAVERYAEVETEQFANLPNSSLTVEGSVFDTQSARRTRISNRSTSPPSAAATWATITVGRGPGDHQVARTRPLGDVVAGAVREFVTANMRRPKDKRELRRGDFARPAAAAETERVAAKVQEGQTTH